MSRIWVLARKELAHGLNGRYAYLLIALFAVSFAVPAFWVRGAANVFVTGLADLRPLLGTFPLFLMVLAPALVMRVYSAERLAGTDELLRTWPVSPAQRTLGKFLGCYALLVPALLATLPLPFLVDRLGDLDWGPVIGAYAGAALLGAACVAVCLYVGRFGRDPVAAFLFGIGALGVGMFLPLKALNLHDRFSLIARGMPAARDLVFYAVVTLLFLVLTILLDAGRPRRRHLPAQVAAVALALLLGFGADRLSWRVDLTQDRLYSLNRTTTELLADLPGEVTLKLFVSSDLPPRFQPAADFVDTLLDEYVARSNGKLTLNRRDPEQDEAAAGEAKNLGVFETRANIFSENSTKAVQLWFGLAVCYGERFEVFPSLQAIENLEYEVSAAVLRLTRTRKPKLLLVGPTYAEGRGVIFDMGADLRAVSDEWARGCAVSQVRLEEDTRLDLSGADAVVLWSLHHFTDAQLYALDQYLVAGGSALILASGMRVDPNMLLAQAVPRARADDYYAHLGFAVGRDLVCDQSCTKVKYTDVRPPVLQPYPLFPVLSQQTKGLDGEHPTTAGLKKLVVPWASSLTAVAGMHGSPRVIAQTSEQAWLMEADYVIDPGSVPGPTSFERYTLGMVLHGPFTSFYEGPPAGAADASYVQRGSHAGTVLVWGSEHLLTQTRDSSVLVWAAQSVAYLTMRGALSGINRRENAFRPIKPTDAAARRTYQRLSVVPIPLCLLLFGLVREHRRRRRTWAGYLGKAPEA